jgi:alkyldihydroxyacetonephosphate synthase
MGKDKHGNFYPDWYEDIPSDKSYRSIFKWGAIDQFKHPNHRLYKLMKETFHMTDEDFKKPMNLGLEEVSYDIPPKMTDEQINHIKQIVGEENVKTDDYSRLQVAYGKTMYDLFRLREKRIENLPDIVVCPRNKNQVAKIVQYCDQEKIPVYVYGGGSTVTRGVEPTKNGITIDMRVHMNKIVRINETNQTVTVEAGMYGPALEEALRDAPERFGTKRRYTTGHLPQSFECSVVGGWVVTRGAGQNSTYYGKIEHLVISQEYITPKGIIKTPEFPAMATGPDVDQIMIGSEGTYGILTECTIKLSRYMPKSTRRFGYIFKTWKDAMNAVREVMQSEAGKPSVFRLSDPEETDVALKLYGVEGTIIDTVMSIRGYKRNQRCLLLGTADGDKRYTRMVKKTVHRVCKRYKAMNLTSYPAKKWEHGRFRDPYMRESMQDFGIIIDTLECAVNWEIMEDVHSSVRKYCKSRPDTICMTHMSHVYPQGANLYFIFIGRFKTVEEFVEYHAGVLDAIQLSGAAMSHHHGIGKLFAPWLEGQIGKKQYDIFQVLKEHFDPNNIMNPGGTLGFDLADSEKRFMKDVSD